MAAPTVLPGGLQIDAAHVGNVTPSVTATGKREAWGTAAMTGAGTVTIATGLTTVEFAVACPYGDLLAGTIGAFTTVTVQPTSGGSIILRGYGGTLGDTPSTQPGTVAWRAVGT